MGELDKIREHVTERTLEDVLEGALHPGERVVWAAEPDLQLAIAPAIVSVFAFLLFVTAVACLVSLDFVYPNVLQTILVVPAAGVAVIAALLAAFALRRVLFVVFRPRAEALYVVTQRRAVVVRSQLGVLEIELGEGTQWMVRRRLLDRTPTVLRIQSPSGEALDFAGLRNPEGALREIEDARKNVRNATSDDPLQPDSPPPPGGVTAVEKFAERKRREREP